MNLSFHPCRRRGEIKYHVDGDVLTVVADEVVERYDFSGFGDGRATKITSSLSACPVLAAERVGGVLQLQLLRAVPPKPPAGDTAALEAWQALWTEEPLESDFVDDLPGVATVDATIDWQSQQEIDAEREAEAWAALRTRRDALLAKCDWTQLPDVPMDPELRQAWQEYRQALRDVPQQEGAPYDVTWPEPPMMHEAEGE